MLVYFLTIFIIFLLSFKDNNLSNNLLELNYIKRNNYFSGILKTNRFLVFLILALVSGLRYHVGTDYGEYSRGFYIFQNKLKLWNDIITFHEPVLAFVCFVSKFIYNDYATMFMIMALLTVFFNVNTISRYSDSFFIGIMLYIFIGSWHGSFNGMRQYLAAAILFAGHRFIKERKFKEYCLIVFSAMLCHRTALIFFPIFFVSTPKHEIRNLILIFLGMILMAYSYSLFFDIMSELKGSDQTKFAYMRQTVNFFRVAVACVPVILLMMLGPKGFLNPDDSFYFKMLIVNAAFMVATSGSAYLARVGVYSEIYATIAFPKLINLFPKENRKLFTIIILTCYFIFWFWEVYSRDSLHYFHWIFERDYYNPIIYY